MFGFGKRRNAVAGALVFARSIVLIPLFGMAAQPRSPQQKAAFLRDPTLVGTLFGIATLHAHGFGLSSVQSVGEVALEVCQKSLGADPKEIHTALLSIRKNKNIVFRSVVDETIKLMPLVITGDDDAIETLMGRVMDVGAKVPDFAPC